MRYAKLLSSAGNCAVGMALLLGGAASLSAQESQSEDPWKFKAAIYLWGAAIGGTTQSGNDFDVSFSDIVDNLDFTFMGSFEARKSKWSAAADVIYLDISSDGSGTIGPRNSPVSANVDVTSWVLNFQGARNVHESEHASVDVLFGARYLSIESKLTATLPSFIGQRTLKSSDDVWDAVAGVKGKIMLSKSWFLPYYLDVGTGGSDFTWQGMAGVGYAFRRVDLVLAYRYLEWQFDSDSAFDDMNISGPLFGAAFKF